MQHQPTTGTDTNVNITLSSFSVCYLWHPWDLHIGTISTNVIFGCVSCWLYFFKSCSKKTYLYLLSLVHLSPAYGLELRAPTPPSPSHPSHTPMHTQTYAHTRLCIQTHDYAYTHTPTHTHLCLRIHIHTYIYILSRLLNSTAQ